MEEEAARVSTSCHQLGPPSSPTIKNHSMEHEQLEHSSLQKQTVEVKHEKNIRADRAIEVKTEEHCISKNGSCVIPGVEHVFFEKELEKMEHHVQEDQIVVLAVDNGTPSEIAFKFYVDHVKREGFILHVVHHTNGWGNLESVDEGPSPKHCQELMVKEEARVREVEDKYKKLIADNHVLGEFIIIQGKDTWHDIIQYQEKVNGIMIVIGTRGQNSLRRTLMGSVSDSVVHHASCPVLVCCHPKN